MDTLVSEWLEPHIGYPSPRVLCVWYKPNCLVGEVLGWEEGLEEGRTMLMRSTHCLSHEAGKTEVYSRSCCFPTTYSPHSPAPVEWTHQSSSLHGTVSAKATMREELMEGHRGNQQPGQSLGGAVAATVGVDSRNPTEVAWRSYDSSFTRTHSLISHAKNCLPWGAVSQQCRTDRGWGKFRDTRDLLPRLDRQVCSHGCRDF